MINFFWSENSDYADVVNTSKNAYLSVIIIYECENVLYSVSVKDFSVNIFNSLMVNKNNSNIYFWTWILESYNIFYSKYIINCNNIWFSTNLTWCSDCIDCSNLNNKKYCINNKEYEKKRIFNRKSENIKK